MMNVMGVLLPSRMAAEVAVTERCGSGAAGTAFVDSRDQACKSFCSVFWGTFGVKQLCQVI